MSLKRLSLWQCQGLLHVLRDQPELEELRLGWSCPGLENLEKTDVPKLQALTASLQEAAHLVPGRPIQRLDLNTSFGSPDFDLQAFDRLSLSTRPITYFSVALYHPREDEGVRAAIRAFARNWPNIESLVLTVAGPISGQTILDEIPSFQSIRELAFLDARLATADDLASSDLSHDYGILQENPLEDWDQLFSRLKELCPTLVKAWHTPLTIFYGCCCGLSM
ncbi:hypothetical protein M407DRAFT_32953 [Tulasnella calospora MUT 4182]|uniref:Uncharacterized protein n=1 Tax=Tulasnella calospora MUT 4182 TaxID=1051891 RepID=A0A0C3K7M7_9AGAM|nr:hypothetical protein M407DRAFT_32953 [Tulasnella calospora MUT 4182]